MAEQEQQVKIRRRFKLQEQLGAGAFGEIFGGVDMQTGRQVAIKLEPVDAEHPQLAYEARVYNQLNAALPPSPHVNVGIPRMLYNGVEGIYNVLVMERKGSNLEALFNRCGRRFSLITVLMLADQMIQLLQYVHEQRLVHRDVKPDNFVIGIDDERHMLFLIDFGLSKCYWNPKKNKHIPFRDDKHLTGTGRYASIGNHKGYEQSRRDDLESMGYVLVYFVHGGLPWQNQRDKSRRTRYQKMMEGKIAAAEKETLWRNLPDAFRLFFNYVFNLEFSETPDYNFCRRLFADALAHESKSRSSKKLAFDWET